MCVSLNFFNNIFAFSFSSSVRLSSNCCNSFIINGKPVKSINRYYNKKKAKLQKRIKKCQNRNKSKRLQKLTEKRNRKVKDYFHKTSRCIVNQLVSNRINTLIIGYNKGWKQEVNIGRRNNQKFVEILSICRILRIIVPNTEN